MSRDIFAVDPQRDLPRYRKIEVPDAPAFVLTQHDPHGFWRITRERGQVPPHLQGDYTKLAYAEQAVQAYVAKIVSVKAEQEEKSLKKNAPSSSVKD